MRKTAVRAFAALLLLMAGFAASTARAQAKYTGWHTDLQTAADKADQTGKPLFVVFRCVR